MKLYNSTAGRIFDVFNYVFLGFVSAITLIPFIYVLAGSFASNEELSQQYLVFIPKHITFSAYQFIFSTPTLLHSIWISVYITVVGTLVNLFCTTTMAYALSRRQLAGRNIILNLVIFSMVFSGGMIPTYLVVKNLGLLNSLWSMILPVAISAFNLIIVKKFFEELPPGLVEAASIDGCSDIGVFWRIALPLSKPMLATFALFYAVGHWDDFMNALLYLNDSTKWPLQLLLQQIVMQSQEQSLANPNLVGTTFVQPPSQTIKMAVIVISMLPVVLVYPWLQKYFVKGVLIGAIKE
ncbi:MAG: carbohydrate ABC transporter permease [Alicyclobacillus herbarius]|uniref:carbohydrate ABC transporter permease n=1 Tax=Alicyclobacillus herbarius TaxID=122960 RepID=UPI0004229798|nr:carbohydrate ABC transporter permease [Alicyclobacillus herbarius]MCL6633152.1 carbohydrate ABC transporter permease [Alicyclobacillus herbarius]